MICLNDSFLKVTPFKKFRGNNGLLKLGESIWYQKHGQASESWKFFHSVTVSTGEMYYWASSVFSVLLWGQKKKKDTSPLPKWRNTSLPHSNLPYNYSQKWDSTSPRQRVDHLVTFLIQQREISFIARICCDVWPQK